MASPFWKRYTPRGLYGRSLLILVAPMVVLLLVVSVVFIQRHYEGVTRQMTRSVAAEVTYLLGLLNAAPSLDAARDGAAGALARSLDVALAAAPVGAAGDRRRFFDLPGRQAIAILREQVPAVRGIDLVTDEDVVALTLGTRHGPVEATFPRERVSASNPHQLLVLTIATGLVMTGIAVLFLRNQLRPIRRLARMAEAFGRGQALTWPPSGATEVRAATRAFLDMRARIERHIEQRTLLLSGVSHDLRTPLTRLKLALSMQQPGPEIDAMQRDLADMEHLIDEFLAFTRDESAEGIDAGDPLAIARAAVADAARDGRVVELVAAPSIEGLTVPMRPRAIRRALDNLLENADRCAERTRLSVAAVSGAVVFEVADDGPGIPPDRRAEALRPFTRLDPGRGQNRGAGVGLGLAIATDIARSHGGRLTLSESADLGGLSAELRIPCSVRR
jgi:two-component system osmolarity sensor histidine kinase EnvZ